MPKKFVSGRALACSVKKRALAHADFQFDRMIVSEEFGPMDRLGKGIGAESDWLDDHVAFCLHAISAEAPTPQPPRAMED